MRYYKAVVFCSNPINGVFKYADVFQIYPLISCDAPQSASMNLYPFVLEYCVDDSKQIEVDNKLEDVKDIVSDLTQSTNFQNRLLGLLTAFSNYRFYFPRVSQQWFISIDPQLSKEEMDGQTSKIGLNVYRYPSLTEDTFITSFSNVEFPDIEFNGHVDYFTHLDLMGEEIVKFPQYMPVAFRQYFLLTKINRMLSTLPYYSLIKEWNC
ncbi:MAG TPA: hypothetical protein VL098_11290 [Flavipsychrobacter sp.]|nr:hypothetical protein [Flavipsychrobacter sp.]